MLLSVHLVIIFFKHIEITIICGCSSAQSTSEENNIQITSGYGSHVESYKGLRRIKSHIFINYMVNALIHAYKVRLIMLKQTNKITVLPRASSTCVIGVSIQPYITPITHVEDALGRTLILFVCFSIIRRTL